MTTKTLRIRAEVTALALPPGSRLEAPHPPVDNSHTDSLFRHIDSTKDQYCLRVETAAQIRQKARRKTRSR
jgi:hypothetical protein